MLVSAQRVVGERADHIAIADRVVAMASDDALELMLQPSELGDLFPHGGKMLGGDAVRLAAGAFRMLAQCQKVPDRLYRKSEVACVADESERFELTLFIAALIALRALRCREQTHLLVIADGRDFYARPPGKIADRIHAPHFSNIETTHFRTENRHTLFLEVPRK